MEQIQVKIKTVKYGDKPLRVAFTPIGNLFNLNDLCRILDVDYDDGFSFSSDTKYQVWTFKNGHLGILRTYLDEVGVFELGCLVKSKKRKKEFREWFKQQGFIPLDYFCSKPNIEDFYFIE